LLLEYTGLVSDVSCNFDTLFDVFKLDVEKLPLHGDDNENKVECCY